jgi:hypothetical protein
MLSSAAKFIRRMGKKQRPVLIMEIGVGYELLERVAGDHSDYWICLQNQAAVRLKSILRAV